MTLRVWMVFLLMCPAVAQQMEQKRDEKPTFQLETFYMAIMSKGSEFDQSKANAITKQELAYWQGIADKGDYIVGGPASGGDGAVVAAFIYRAVDAERGKEIAAADPMVKGRQWTVKVLAWGTQKDVLKPLKNYDPVTACYLGFLKRGEKWSPEETPERERIQQAHLKNIGRLHDLGKLVAAGPFMEDDDLRGIFVFKTASMEEANELTNTDPAVKAGRLRIELHEWKVPAEAFTERK